MSDTKVLTTTTVGSSVRQPRIAVTAVFVVQGLLFASWTAHIPDVKGGAKLALVSNAPEPLARAIDHCFWSRHFDHRHYSCRLAAAKPDPQAFQIVLHDLGAQPGEVLFIDDRAENTLTARDLGMHTITFASASALDHELHLITVASWEAAQPLRLDGSWPQPR